MGNTNQKRNFDAGGQSYFQDGMTKAELAALIRREAKVQRESPRFPIPSEDESCNQVLNGLHIGDGLAFLDCTKVEVVRHDHVGRRLGLRQHGNPLGFHQVLTMCPLSALCEHSDDFQTNSPSQMEQLLAKQFKKANIQWRYAGRSVCDAGSHDTAEVRALKWDVLVHDCSVEPEESALAAFEITGSTPDTCAQNQLDKRSALARMEATDWFATVFPLLEACIFNNQKCLVHCAQGVSRSVSVVIAYLVYALDVDPEDAILFVKSRRPVADPAFAKQLATYANDLKRLRMPTE